MAERTEGNLDQMPTPEEVLWRLREYPLGGAVVDLFTSCTDPRSYHVGMGGRNEFCLSAAPKDARVPVTLVLSEYCSYVSRKPGLELLIFQTDGGWQDQVVRVWIGPSPTGRWVVGLGNEQHLAADAGFGLREINLFSAPTGWIFGFLAKLADRLNQEGWKMAREGNIERWWQSDEGGSFKEGLSDWPK